MQGAFYTTMASQDSLEYLSKLGHKGIHLGLGPTSRLLKQFNNPQIRYKSILIGGTNGKGSVAAILSSILGKTGKKIGLYTSPHLIDFRERIRVNGRMISQERLCNLIDVVRAKTREDLTYFEFTTVLAFLYFYLEGVDIAVLEVGMGGRLDATNLVTPEASVITNVSLEHKEYLGNTIGSIAWEKGGIIKRGGVCITAANRPVVIDILENICLQKGAGLFRYGKDMKIRKTKGGRIFYNGIDKTYRDMSFPLIGRHQVKNAALALAAVEVLASRGLDVDDNAVSEGLSTVRWEGRLETVSLNPRIVVDGAHNPAGISALCNSLTTDFSYERLICVFGVLADKDCKKMLGRLAGIADHMILTSPSNERALNPDDMSLLAGKLHSHIEIAKDSQEAIARASSVAGKEDLICVTGSIYLVGEVKCLFLS